MSPDARAISLPSTVVWTELDDEMVLLDVAGERYYSLDDVGKRVWQLLEAHGDADAVVARMLDEFAVDEATLRADVTVLLAELRERGLIE